jgi:hypothetical protein
VILNLVLTELQVALERVSTEVAQQFVDGQGLDQDGAVHLLDVVQPAGDRRVARGAPELAVLATTIFELCIQERRVINELFTLDITVTERSIFLTESQPNNRERGGGSTALR